MSPGLRIAVVGLRFGAEFAPIYAAHPAVEEVIVVDTDAEQRERVGRALGVTRRLGSLEEALAAEDIDAVHLVTPVALHARQTLAVLGAGKHCACAVPMATTTRDIEAIIAAVQRSGRRYMMMETTVFAREFLYVRDLLRDGELGEPTFYRGFHIQDLDGFPSYWTGFPPMHYVTHALSPALALLGTTAERVSCLGSSVLTEDRRGDFDNTYPLETGIFRLREESVVANVTMSFFQTARAYTEGYALYGTRRGVEWPTAEEGPLLVHELQAVPDGGRGRPVTVSEVSPPDRTDLLPDEIAPFVADREIGGMHIAAAHGGSHPHLVHEFVSSIVEDRAPLVDARTAAAWSAAGICAHHSAMTGGAWIEIPSYLADGGA